MAFNYKSQKEIMWWVWHVEVWKAGLMVLTENKCCRGRGWCLARHVVDRVNGGGSNPVDYARHCHKSFLNFVTDFIMTPRRERVLEWLIDCLPVNGNEVPCSASMLSLAMKSWSVSRPKLGVLRRGTHCLCCIQAGLEIFFELLSFHSSFVITTSHRGFVGPRIGYDTESCNYEHIGKEKIAQILPITSPGACSRLIAVNILTDDDKSDTIPGRTEVPW